MYNLIKKYEYLHYFNLPEDYVVDALICYGHWDKPRHINYLKQSLQKLDATVTYEQMPLGFLQNVVSFTINGKRVWFDAIYGSALLTEVEHSACLFGSKVNIHLGSCGSLLKDPSVELLIPKLANSRDSAAMMYNDHSLSSNYYPDRDLLDLLYSRVSAEKKTVKGNVITCEAMMAESMEYFNEVAEKGYSGVNMETATFYAIGKRFNVPSISMLKVGESIFMKETKLSESYKVKREAVRPLVSYMYDVGLETIRKYID
jgi:purine-nucleoside phosphorylase